MRKPIDQRHLAVTGNRTTTYLGYNAYQEFYNWVANKVVDGNKEILEWTKNMDKDLFLERALSVAQDATAISKIEKIQSNGKQMATFGDLDVLQKLKSKMEGNG
jgi:hypothetical protein